MDKKDLLKEVPVIAIIRGVKPEEAVDVAEAMYEAGIRAVEVPLNSPNPFVSIKLIADALGDKMLVGAGTVLTVEQVQKVYEAGGQIIVSPNMDEEVIEATKGFGMYSYPGVMTVTECFAALEAGADGLKLFPADVVGMKFIKAAKVVLPEGTQVFAVGGVNDQNMSEWTAAGADGFGLGSSLYKPGMPIAEIRQLSEKVVESLGALV
ncbi:MAG: 2-dehydro-3-deoxy-6-phosphogalactonate aldolase [Lentisphaerales bacterium]|nr:2-dehydro-3-deoxy-6-phosphogalactonate aldolase [Lentisphaerales bacterium]